MNKKFKFKLEAVLKMRKLAEEQVKMEIGRLNVTIGRWEQEIIWHEQGIKDAYAAQESELGQTGLTGQEARFHPYFVQGKRAHIDAIKAEIKMLESERDKKYQELNKRRGEVKVIENLKDKALEKYKKERQKRMNQVIEEDVIKWSHRKRQEKIS